MYLVGALLVGRAETDDGLAGDEGRAVGFLRGLDGGSNRIRIMAIDADGVPVNGLEAGDLVGAVGEANFTVDGDVVVVPEQNELVELQVAGKRDGFVADAFHEAAVAAKHIGKVALQVGAEFLFQLAFGNSHADGVGDALAERAGGRFDAGRMAIFGMAGGLGAELTETLDLVDRHVLVARQIEQRVKQHRTMACRQHEAVAVSPERRLGIEFQVTGEKNGGDISGAHRQTGVA
ncbi:hypothetical protein D3C78_957760 [compost metagenome]